ncbi:hypothetical protein [Neobacillus cucumis]|nr:hypothetical protein [Neobacillus cucumis]MBM7653479.1 hypothetical protein [Neobacillus cucumis]
MIKIRQRFPIETIADVPAVVRMNSVRKKLLEESRMVPELLLLWAVEELPICLAS